MKRTQEGGYVGLVVLMVSVTIVALLFARVYLTPHEMSEEEKAIQPLSASGTAPSTEIQQMHADVDAANAIREKLNVQNEETNKIMQE
jgi:hypothetical protein